MKAEIKSALLMNIGGFQGGQTRGDWKGHEQEPVRGPASYRRDDGWNRKWRRNLPGLSMYSLVPSIPICEPDFSGDLHVIYGTY